MSLVSLAVGAAELPPLEGRTNLAAGRPAVFSPQPNYAITGRGGTDSTDLTDGKLTRREDRRIWFEPSSVGWSYGGRVNLAIDLGKPAKIDEIAIRLLGGSASTGASVPGWIEAVVSEDGQHFTKVAECSRWREGDFARYGVPDEEGKAWIHCLRFTDLRAHGRWVGLRMYSAGLSVSDELYVFGSPEGEGGDHGAARVRLQIGPTGKEPARLPSGRASDFTVAHPQPYFHKPRLVLATNFAGPIPLGVVVPPGRKSATLEMTFELPPGIEFLGGEVAETSVRQFAAEELQGGGKRYRVKAAPRASSKVMGRLYVQASGWKDGQEGKLRYRFRSGGWESPDVEVPIQAVEVPAAPRLKRIMAGLGWWNATETAQWPGALDAWQRIGLNTFNVFPAWMKEGDPSWKLVDEARHRGFFISSIDSPLHRMLDKAKGRPEIYCQFADGTTGHQLCPSYRGPFYREEMQRFARGMGQARPDFTSVDIEVWGWRGPVDSARCTRCQADFKASGLPSLDQWYVAKGVQMWHDLVVAARAEVARAGGRPFEIGGYDFRPGAAYQSVWSVDRLYPEWMQSSQVSTYTCLNPYHLGLIGDEVREDRKRLAHSDVEPWITPGDAGTFPAESFQWALLECYTNGARGVWFWSGRVWDTENLIACNRVVRAIAPVEGILLNGELAGDAAAVEGPGRVSGIRRGDDLVVLAADYCNRSKGSLSLRLKINRSSEIYDLCDRKKIGATLAAGDQRIELPLGGAGARLLDIRPIR